jgi:hypothetical protein
MKTAISIPDDVFRKAEYLAKKRGLSRSQFYVMAIKEFMMDRENGITEALNRVYGDQESLEPSVERAALSDLPRDEW